MNGNTMRPRKQLYLERHFALWGRLDVDNVLVVSRFKVITGLHDPIKSQVGNVKRILKKALDSDNRP